MVVVKTDLKILLNLAALTMLQGTKHYSFCHSHVCIICPSHVCIIRKFVIILFKVISLRKCSLLCSDSFHYPLCHCILEINLTLWTVYYPLYGPSKEHMRLLISYLPKLISRFHKMPQIMQTHCLIYTLSEFQ